MNTFKRKALMSAVLASLGAAGTAEAVFEDANGLGQVLVYPYYTVQQRANGDAFNTLISVVNTTARAKVVKVRFREGKTSAEVLDFNLYLSPNDVWTAAIIPASGTQTVDTPARLITTDQSCTNPAIPATGVDFRNFLYLAGSVDGLPGSTLDRTREGYLEMIEMGTLTGASAAAATHSAGVPSCTGLRGPAVALTSIEAPLGGLSGQGTIVNVVAGSDVGYNAIALAEFRTLAFYTDIANDSPNLSSADPMSVVVSTGVVAGTAATPAPAGLTVYRSDWAAQSGTTAGARAVASVFMHSSVINEYVLDSGSLSQTDWVITQPLKRFFVSSTTVAQPYTNVLTSTGACETIGFTFFNREEGGATAAGVDFSPASPGGPSSSLCWESTVLSIYNAASTATVSGVLGSFNLRNVAVTSGFQNGWAFLTFTGAGAVSPLGLTDSATSNAVTMVPLAATTSTHTYIGLPVTGFMVRTFRNNNVPCGTATCLSSYASAFPHVYRTTIVP